MSAPTLSSFALIAVYNASGDSSLPFAANFAAIPNPVPAGTPVTLSWLTTNVATIDIIGATWFDSGMIPTLGSGLMVVPNGFTENATLTMTCYDANGNTLTSIPFNLTVTNAITEGIALDVNGDVVSPDVTTLDVNGDVVTTDVTNIVTD